MLTAILLSAMLLAVISIVRSVGNHIICAHDDNIYEIVCGVVWCGWFVTVFIYCAMLIHYVNVNEVVLQWKPQHLS